MREKLFLICFGIVFALIECEVGLRLSKHQLFSTELLSARYHPLQNGGDQAIAQYDKYLGWLPVVGQYKNYGWDMASITVVDDNIRSNENHVRFSNSKNILAIGDSFTFGVEVNDTESWPSYLERRLETRVVNGGVSGYGVDQAIMRAEDLIKKYSPSVTIFSLFPNDVERCGKSVFTGNYKPYYSLENDNLTLHNSPVPISQVEKAKDMTFMNPRKLFGYSFLVDAVMRRVSPNYWLNEPTILLNRAPPKMENTNTIDIACKLIETRLAPLQTKDNKIIFLIEHSKNPGSGDTLISVKTAECARKAGLEVIDTGDDFIGIKNTTPDFYNSLFRNHGHLSSVGNKIIANKLFHRLKDIV